MQPGFDAIVFDLGGVIVRYRARPRILDWIGDRFTLDQLWERWISSKLVRSYETGRISPRTFAEGIIREYGLSVTPDEYLAQFAESHEAVYDGAPQMLTKLAPSYTLAALSNTNETLWQRCEMLGILPYFHHLFPSHKIGYVKPDPRIYEHALKVLNIPPTRVLFFDDTEENVAAARALGIAGYTVDGLADVEATLRELNIGTV